MKEYFYKSEYKWLYLSRIFYAFGNSFLDLFGVVMLHKNGMPLYLIFLLYGVRFGIMGLCSPLFLKIASNIGIAKCAILANLLRVVGVYMIQNGAQKNLVLFLIVMSLPGALSNPIEDVVSSQYVENEHRGKYNSMRNIARICGQVLASLMVGVGIALEKNTLVLLLIAIAFLLDYFCMAMIDFKPQISSKRIFRETIQYSLKSKSNYQEIYALRANHVVERLFLPLYVYLVLQNFITFTLVITISLLLQIMVIGFVGKMTDKDGQKTTRMVTFFKSAITAIFLCVKSKETIAFNKILSDNFEKVYETTIQSNLQNLIKESNRDNSFLATIGQMNLCFTEVIMFLLLGLVSYFIGNGVFNVIFILSIVSSLGINFVLNSNCKT